MLESESFFSSSLKRSASPPPLLHDFPKNKTHGGAPVRELFQEGGHRVKKEERRREKEGSDSSLPLFFAAARRVGEMRGRGLTFFPLFRNSLVPFLSPPSRAASSSRWPPLSRAALGPVSSEPPRPGPPGATSQRGPPSRGLPRRRLRPPSSVPLPPPPCSAALLHPTVRCAASLSRFLFLLCSVATINARSRAYQVET